MEGGGVSLVDGSDILTPTQPDNQTPRLPVRGTEARLASLTRVATLPMRTWAQRTPFVSAV